MRTLLACSAIALAVAAPSTALAQSLVGGGSGETTGAAPAGGGDSTETKAAPAPVADVAPSESITDVSEKDHKTYYFIGARYRGTVIPKFMVNMFVDEGATFYSNMIGIEAEIRKDHFSLIPALNYVEYGFDPVVFLEKGKSGEGNYSIVHSNLAGIYLTLDMLWSTPVHKNIDFEYGLGVGVGVLFGNIYNNWATQSPQPAGTTNAKASDGSIWYECQTQSPAGSGCDPAKHTSPNPPKVGGYKEKMWTDGGSVPNVFLHLALPQLGLRIKPIKNLEMRVQVGFSLTGFWFGLSADGGLETRPKKGEAPGAK